MTREEEIQKLIDEETGIDNYGSSDYQIGVCDGVRLADKTMLDQLLQWLPIDRDKNGFATEECLESMRKAIPFVYVAIKEVYIAIGNENDFNVYIDGFKTDAFDVTHYLPIPKLEV